MIHVITFSAGCYIKKERADYKRPYGIANYLKDIEKAGRDFAEKQTKPVCNYPHTLSAAIAMTVMQQKHLHKVC